MKTLLSLMLLFLSLLFLAPTDISARAVYTPRDSGTEPPGGPRAPEGLPAPGNFGRTDEGGMGMVDAYGNTIVNRRPEEKTRKRLPQGAYGRYEEDRSASRPLPDPGNNSRPAWSFR